LKRVVLDASVILKWYLPDEDQSEAALDLLKRYISGNQEIIAPSLLEYELMNGLLVARKRSRVREDMILSAFEGFTNLGIVLMGLSGQYPRIIYFCNTYTLSAYDARYLSLAESEKIPLITADENLYKAVKMDLHWVKRLGEA
jgi:predicted nucleic acid-binding protein